MLSSDACRVCNEEEERDALHVLKCKYRMLSQFRNEKVTTLQLQLIKMLDEDMLPLCLLEWMLDPEHEAIEGVPEKHALKTSMLIKLSSRSSRHMQ